jgi:hypothetical protein
MSGVFDSIVGGTRTPRQYNIVYSIPLACLAHQFVLSPTAGANDKGKHPCELVSPHIRSQHVQGAINISTPMQCFPPSRVGNYLVCHAASRPFRQVAPTRASLLPHMVMTRR